MICKSSDFCAMLNKAKIMSLTPDELGSFGAFLMQPLQSQQICCLKQLLDISGDESVQIG